MRGVDLNDTEPGLACATRGCCKSGDNFLNAITR